MNEEQLAMLEARWTRRGNGRVHHDVKTACATWDHERYADESRHSTSIADSKGNGKTVRSWYSPARAKFCTSTDSFVVAGGTSASDKWSDTFDAALALHEELAASIIELLDIEDGLRVDGCGEALMSGVL